MTVEEFRRLGYLQELNRRFLHPLGLALSVLVWEDGTVMLGEIWDYRDDPEGIRFETSPSAELPERSTRISAEWEARKPARVAALGYMIQPLDQEGTTS